MSPRQAPPRLTDSARGCSSPGVAFRATRLAVRNCKKGIDAELGMPTRCGWEAARLDRIAGPLRFARLRGSMDQAIYGCRDIINPVFTCLPDKNCPHRDRAAPFPHVLS